MKQYKAGIIGFGFIGKVHAYGYLNLPLFYDPLPLHARVTHVCTSSMATAEKGKAQINADVATTDFRAITESPDVDIVHICTPNHLHKDALLSAIRHNKHIYCDKPLVTSMAEAEEIWAAAKNYTGTAQMTLQNRFFPAVMRAKQLVDEGRLGKVLEYRAAYLHAGSANPNTPLKWKLSGASGGGVIADLASHVLDLVQHLVGDFTAVSAASHIAYPDRPSVRDPNARVPVDAEDCVMFLARNRDNALGCIEATKIATGTEDEFRFEVHGSKGALKFNSMEPHFLEVFDASQSDQPIGGISGWTRIATGQRFPSPAAAFPGVKFSMGWLRAHVACLANFLNDVALKRPGEPGLDQGVYIQYLIERVRESCKSGQWVACKPNSFSRR
jgi:predicted dehydrogenase